MAFAQPIRFGAPFSKDLFGDEHSLLLVERPEAFVKHPVCIACESEAIVGRVVPTFGKGMYVCGFNQ